MPQWIGSNEFFAENPDKRTNSQNAGRHSDIHNRLENAEANLQREVSDARQLRRNAPPKPAAQRQPGYPSRVITQREADVMRPPRQYSIPGSRRVDRPIWPENIARGASEKIPVHEGMLDGQSASVPNRQPERAERVAEHRAASAEREAYRQALRENAEANMRQANAERMQAADQAYAPMYRPDAQAFTANGSSKAAENRATSHADAAGSMNANPAGASAIAGAQENYGEQGSVLSVSGIRSTTARPVCDVGREMREVSSSLERNAMEQRELMARLHRMEMRIHMLERQIELISKMEPSSASLYDEEEMEELMEISEQHFESSPYDDEDEREEEADEV